MLFLQMSFFFYLMCLKIFFTWSIFTGGFFIIIIKIATSTVKHC